SWWGRTGGEIGWFETKRGCAAAFLSIARQRFVTCDPRTDLSHRLWSWFRAVSSSTSIATWVRYSASKARRILQTGVGSPDLLCPAQGDRFQSCRDTLRRYRHYLMMK